MGRECFPEVVIVREVEVNFESPRPERNAIFGRVHAILFGKIVVHEEAGGGKPSFFRL